MAGHFTPWYLQRSGTKRRSTLLLDQLSVAPIAAFATRKQKASNTSLLRVRREDTAAVQDIGTVASGEIDSAAIASFASGTTGRCLIWYDLTGNGFDITHPTPTATPVIYTGGAVVTLGAKTSHVCSGAQALFRNDAFGLSGDIDLTVVSAFKQNTNITMPWSLGTSTNNRAFYLLQDNAAGGIDLGYYGNGRSFTLASAISSANYYTCEHASGGNTHSGSIRQNGSALTPGSTIGAAGTFDLSNTTAVWGGGPLPAGGFLSGVNGNFWLIFDQVLGAEDRALCEAEAAFHAA